MVVVGNGSRASTRVCDYLASCSRDVCRVAVKDLELRRKMNHTGTGVMQPAKGAIGSLLLSVQMDSSRDVTDGIHENGT